VADRFTAQPRARRLIDKLPYSRALPSVEHDEHPDDRPGRA
jgi:hypothetical protein